MITRAKTKKPFKHLAWEEKSGFLDFLSGIQRSVDIFNKTFGFGISHGDTPLNDIDGNGKLPAKAGFVLKRDNPLVGGSTYCLFSVLKDKVLYGYIGIYRDSRITTLKELKPIEDFKKGELPLYEWMKQLVLASCEKMTL
jgi:hypothetical protein